MPPDNNTHFVFVLYLTTECICTLNALTGVNPVFQTIPWSGSGLPIRILARSGPSKTYNTLTIERPLPFGQQMHQQNDGILIDAVPLTIGRFAPLCRRHCILIPVRILLQNPIRRPLVRAQDTASSGKSEVSRALPSNRRDVACPISTAPTPVRCPYPRRRPLRRVS